MKCAVKNCKNNNNKRPCTISFFTFPSDPSLLKQWKSLCERNINVKTSQICMEHFKPEDFENNLEYEMGFTKRRFLKRGAVPTVPKLSSAEVEHHKARAQQIQKRENKKIVEMLIKEHDAKSVSLNVDASEPFVQPIKTEISMVQPIKTEISMVQPIKTEISMESQFHPEFEVFFLECKEENFSKNNFEENEIECLKKEIERLSKENCALKETSRNQTAELRYLKEKREKESKLYLNNLHGLKVRLAKANYALNNLEEKLLSIFTKGQIAKLKAGDKRRKWNEEDITHARTLYSASPKLYKLLHRKHFPLPAVRTLQAWVQKVHITPLLLEPSSTHDSD